jgi:hypothetical protein
MRDTIIPSIEDITKNLNGIRIQLVLNSQDCSEFRIHCFVDRIGISDGWVILHGDPSYDPAHGNLVSSGVVTVDMNEQDIKELAINAHEELCWEWYEYRTTKNYDPAMFVED